MKITAISAQARNPDRVNVSVDGKYRFSLDIAQVVELGVKVGREYSEEELAELETESQFGKLYARALEYCLMRPHSAREVRDYLQRKTRPKKILKHISYRKGSTFARESERGDRSREGSSAVDSGERLVDRNRIVEIAGVSQPVADRVYARLLQKGHIDDERFARYWVENRNQAKGASRRKLQAELRAKGVEPSIIDAALAATDRSDEDELAKIIAKKRAKYPDDQKFMQYLARQGFSYDDIKTALQQE